MDHLRRITILGTQPYTRSFCLQEPKSFRELESPKDFVVSAKQSWEDHDLDHLKMFRNNYDNDAVTLYGETYSEVIIKLTDNVPAHRKGVSFRSNMHLRPSSKAQW